MIIKTPIVISKSLKNCAKLLRTNKKVKKSL